MYKRLKAFIKKHETITIFAHIYPDGDALGSIIGMRELIKTNYPTKKVYALSQNVEPYTSIIGPVDEVSDDVIKGSAALILDVADSARVGDQRFKLAHASFKMDHHIFAETFSDDEIVNNDRIAVAEMVGEFLLKENLEISSDGATALMLGIITDSGRFFYDLTSPLTFEVMSVLFAKGGNLKRINEGLAAKKLDGLKTRGYFMSNYETYHSVLYIALDYKTINEFGLKATDGSAFVNTYGNYDGYPVWATFFSDENGMVFCELRSKSKNVQKVAKAFGGGGHLKASGCRLSSSAEIPALLAALDHAEEIS